MVSLIRHVLQLRFHCIFKVQPGVCSTTKKATLSHEIELCLCSLQRAIGLSFPLSPTHCQNTTSRVQDCNPL